MPISEATYERVALEDPEGHWELVCGRLRSKPGMTTAHNAIIDALHYELHRQLDRNGYVVRADAGRLRISTGTHYIPDLCVIPRAVEDRKLQEASARLEIFDEPMPLVVEVWLPSTGDYDVETKLQE